MSMIFSALVVTLLLAVVIVNTLDAHEEAQKEEDELLEIQPTNKYLLKYLLLSQLYEFGY